MNDAWKYATDFFCSKTSPEKVDDIITLYSDGGRNHGLCAQSANEKGLGQILEPVMQPLPADVTFGELQPAVEAILKTKYVNVITVEYQWVEGEGYVQRRKE
jgi:hypothetical protein